MKLIPTKEQQAIVDSAVAGDNLIVKAFAGSAKTSTCVMVAEKLQKHSLYVAFNKSIATEAKDKFPSSVICKTMHSLAYGAIVTPGYRKKLQGWFNMQDIEVPIGTKDADKLRLETIELVKGYCQSKHKTISTFAVEQADNLGIVQLDLDVLTSYWKVLIDEDDKTKITHDVYLKLYQLSQPILGFETIYLDEAQDSNEVTLDIVLSQKRFGTQLVIVGDSYQAIYAWRGAVDALDKLGAGFEELYLTESFRFTQEVADIAEKVIGYLGSKQYITGRAASCNYNAETATKATIVRNNSTLLATLMTARMADQKVYVLANLKSLWPKLFHIDSLLAGNPIKYPDRELKQYKTKEMLIQAAEKLPEINKLIGLVYGLRNNGGVYQAISEMKETIVTTPEEADFTLTTCHKSKGLEWDEVTLTEDLFSMPSNFEGDSIEYLQQGQVGELLYVGITRAKYIVNLPIFLRELIY